MEEEGPEFEAILRYGDGINDGGIKELDKNNHE